jgi:DNA invertase Pin-like site-specific DNA recombinase
MITDAQERKDFSVILVWSQDRFSRLTADETGYFRTLLKNSGVEIISITESWLNGEDIGSRIARNAMQEVKHEYVRDMAKSVIRGQPSNIVDARSDPGRRAPYGYDRALLNSDNTIYQIIRWFLGGIREIYTADGKLQRRVEKGIRLKKEKGLRAILIPGEEKQIDAVRKIFRFCVNGSGFKAIADNLNAERIPAPNGGWWTHTGVKAILENHAYRGAICWNKRSEGKFFKASADGMARVRPSERTASGNIKTIDNSESEWIIVDNTHEALVSPDLWGMAQAAVKGRSKYRGGAGNRNVYLLANLMNCSNCGKKFWGFKKNSGKKPSGAVSSKFYYSCAGYHSSGKHSCVSVHVPARDYESWLLSNLQRMVFADGDTVKTVVENFVAEISSGNSGSDTAARLKKIADERRDINRRIRSLLDNIDPENMVFVNGKLGEFRQRLEELDREAEQASNGRSRNVSAGELREFAYSKLSRLHEAITGKTDIETTKQVIAAYVAKIEVDPVKKQIDTYLYRDALPFIPKEFQDDTETAATPNPANPIIKPESAIANPGFSECGRGERIRTYNQRFLIPAGYLSIIGQ